MTGHLFFDFFSQCCPGRGSVRPRLLMFMNAIAFDFPPPLVLLAVRFFEALLCSGPSLQSFDLRSPPAGDLLIGVRHVFIEDFVVVGLSLYSASFHEPQTLELKTLVGPLSRSIN